MKLRFSFIFVFVALFAVSVCAEDIAYVVKDTSRLNHDFLNAISDLGLSVRVIDDNSIGSVNLANYKMVLVGNDRFDTPSSIPVNDYPTLMVNQYYMDDWGWVSTISSVGSSQPLQARNVYLNQITEGLPEYVQVYDSCCYNGVSIQMYYLAKEKRPVKLKTVTSTVSDKLNAVISISTKGITLRDGKVSKAKGVFFGITESEEWTQNAEDLFKNSIMWLVNQPPRLTSSIPPVSFEEDTELVDAYNLDDYFVDDEGDDMTYNMTGGTHIKAVIDGSFVTLYADPNWYGSEQVRFVASSTDQSTQSNLVMITVNSVNDAPVLADIPDMTFVEKDYIKINATATDIDGDTVTITYSSPLNSRGEWQTQLGDEGIYTIDVTADDMRGGTDSASFDITVLPKVYINEFSLEGWVELYNPNDYDTDMASWTLESSLQTITLDEVIDSKEFLVFNLNLVANDRILLNYNGVVVDSVAFGTFNDGNTADNAPSPAIPKSAARKSDGYDTKNNKFDFIILEFHTKGLSNLADVTPPVVTLISPDDGFVFTDLSRTTSARFSVSDNKALELDCEFYIDESGEFEPVASMTVRSGNVGTFTLSDLEDRTYLWNVQCFDGSTYAFAQSSRTLIVDVNDPPEIVEFTPEDLNPEVYENDSLEFTQTSTDPEGQPLTYSWAVNGVEKATTESFVYVTGFFDAGNRTVKLTVSDSGGRTATNEWVVTVINVNRLPYLSVEIPLLNFDEDKLGVLDLRDYFADEDEESLYYEVVDEDVSTVHCSIGLSNLYMEPARNYNGEASCVIVATDGIDYSEEVTVNMLVNPINDAPKQLEDIPGQAWDEDTSLDGAFDLDDYFEDVDGDVLTYTFTGNSNITITIDEDNVVSFSQPDDWYGIEYVRFIASDGNLTDDTNSVRLQVRNVNDAPGLSQIPEQVLDEDTEITLDVVPYFSDKEGASLKFSVADEDASEVDCSITGSNLTITPVENFFGDASCSIVANDGSSDSEPNVISIVVNPVDDAPELVEDIPSQTWDEDTSLDGAFDLDDYFEDVDGDVLTYTFAGNSNIDVVVDSDNVVSFSQPGDWFGSETVVFTASDLTTSVSSNDVVLTINDVNEPPVMDDVPEQTIEEDSSSNTVPLNATDVDGTIEMFVVKEEDLSKVDCEVSGSTLSMVPAKDFFGDASCTVEVVDNVGGKDSKVVVIHVTNVNDSPLIDSYSPVLDPVITEDGTQEFKVTYHDIDSSTLSVSWYVDGVLSGSGDVFNYNASGAGEFEVKVVVSDSEFETDHKWMLTAARCPVTKVFTGSTTDFCSLTDEQLSDLDCVVLEKPGYGKIDFCGSLMDLSDVIYLDKYIDISPGFIALDSTKLPTFAGKSAKIVMYNIVSDGTPTIYYNNGFTVDPKQVGAVCPPSICSNVNYDGSTLEFTVAHFSSFKVVSSSGTSTPEPGAKTCSELNGYVCNSGDICPTSWLAATDTSYCCSVACSSSSNNDDKDDNQTYENLETCSAGIVGNLDVEIKEPDSGDDFKPGEIITVEVKVKNKADKDLDVKVDAVLFDKDDDDVLDDASDDIDIDEDDDDTLTFELEVPDDVKESHDIIIYAKAFEDGDEDKHCNDDRINIDIKREKHDVILHEVRMTPPTLVCDNSFIVSFTADNVGKEDETLYFTVRQLSLEVDFRSDLFDLDEGDDIFRSLTSTIPKGSVKGYYPVEITIYFEDGDIADSETLDLSILDCITEGVTSEGIPIVAGVPSPEGVATLTLLRSSFDVEPGASITVPAVVKNTGKRTVTFNLDAPATKSYASILEKPKFTLKPGQSTTVYLYLNTKADASEGKYSASVDLMVDGLVVDSRPISVELSREVEKQPLSSAIFIPGLDLGTLALVFVTVLVVIFFIFALVWLTYKPKRRRF